jgi:hypothetical protein
MNTFKEFWKIQNDYEKSFSGDKALSVNELKKVQQIIKTLQDKGLPSSKIIVALQQEVSKLSEKYKAERAYWTEVKRDDTKTVGELGEDLGISKYQVILSPSACKICRNKTENGKKIFKNSDIAKSGWGHVPPFHPGCYCIIIPKE